MKAILLAAGEGRRLALTRFYGSKVLIPVRKKPILEWNLLFLKRNGIRNIVINLCCGKEKILAFLKSRKFPGMRIDFSCENKPLGTAGGVKKAEAMLGKQDFLVVYGDNLCDFDIPKLFRVHRKKKALATLGVFDPRATSHSGILAGFVRIDEQGKVEKFIEKRDNQKIPADGYVNAGVAIFSPDIFGMIPQRRFCDFGKNIYPKLIQCHKRLFAATGATYVLASDTAAALQKTRYLAAKIL